MTNGASALIVIGYTQPRPKRGLSFTSLPPNLDIYLFLWLRDLSASQEDYGIQRESQEQRVIYKKVDVRTDENET